MAIRKRMQIKLSGFCIIWFCMLGCQGVYAKERLTWIYRDFPPYFITSGKFEGQGSFDQQIQILQEFLKGYEHQKIVGTVKRTLHELKNKNKVCGPLLKTTEREKFLSYSIPWSIDPPHSLIIKKSKSKYIENTQIASLEKLLKNDRLRLGVKDGTSYGKILDPILDRYRGQKHVHEREGIRHYEGLLKMLMADRLDYILGYGVETGFVAQTLGVADEIMGIPLQEHLGTYSISHLACPKTAWGHAVIKKINRILRRERPSARYRAIQEQWLDPNLLESYRKVYNDIFLKMSAVRAGETVRLHAGIGSGATRAAQLD